MKTQKKWALKTKLTGTILILIALLMAGSYVSLRTIEGGFRKSIEDSFADNARDLGVKIGTQFFERYGDVQAFALNDSIRRLDAKAITPVLDRYASIYNIYDLILVVDKEGHAVAMSSKDSTGKAVDAKALHDLNFSSASWFKAVMSEQTTDDKEKGFEGTYVEDFVSDPVLRAAFGEQRYSSSFSTAIRNDRGEIVGVITNRTNPHWFEADVKTFYESLRDQGMPTSQFMVTNHKGQLILSYDPSSANNNLDVAHDTKRLLKDNLAKDNYPPALAAEKADIGQVFAKDLIDQKKDTVVGFRVMDNPKWPKSIGWTVYLAADYDDAFADIERVLHIYYVISAICFLIASAVGFFIANQIAKSIGCVTETMTGNAAEVQAASGLIATSSVQLSDSASQQAAALQETVAAVDEISAMVEKNAEAANRSKDVSSHSREAAERGRTIVGHMIEAIGEIDNANEQISTQMEASNRELSEITNLINDIGSKTKVINEIVFQTKLLSFNASVEAARAGEYGKGFAVVAEEVGNLAEMSGTAAKEISALLETSVRKVEAIVGETRTRVERLTTLSKDKVKSGSEVAKDCNSALEEILENVQAVDSLVSEIAVASSEQSTGIREISKAIGQMEQVTQQNSSVAQNSSSAAGQLSAQSSQLNSLVQDLREIVTGSREATDDVKVEAPKKSSSKKVVQMPKREKREAPAEEFKMAASNDVVPSSNDPGFEE